MSCAKVFDSGIYALFGYFDYRKVPKAKPAEAAAAVADLSCPFDTNMWDLYENISFKFKEDGDGNEFPTDVSFRIQFPDDFPVGKTINILFVSVDPDILDFSLDTSTGKL